MADSQKGHTETLAERFLSDAQEAHRPVSVYLLSGFQLKGEVVKYDDGAILFKHRGVHQMVMRHAVANMYPLGGSKGQADEWWSEYVPATSVPMEAAEGDGKGPKG